MASVDTSDSSAADTSSTKSMKLSLVTGTRNRPTSFQRLVRSIVEHTSVDWELIVSDASEQCISETMELPPGVTVLHENPPLGYVKGYNRAFRRASGEWVTWLNDDAEVLEGYDIKAIEFMESHPKIGLGCLAFSDRCWPDSRVQTFWGIPYANFGIMRRELGNEIGWFWEAIRMYGSDNSITFEVLLHGYGVAPIPGRLLHHHRIEDEVRASNEIGRRDDSKKLAERYRGQLPYLRAAYNKALV